MRNMYEEGGEMEMMPDKQMEMIPDEQMEEQFEPYDGNDVQHRNITNRTFDHINHNHRIVYDNGRRTRQSTKEFSQTGFS